MLTGLDLKQSRRSLHSTYLWDHFPFVRNQNERSSEQLLKFGQLCVTEVHMSYVARKVTLLCAVNGGCND